MISDTDLLAYIRPASDDELDTLRRLERGAVALVQKKTGLYLGVAGAITEVIHWKGWPMALSNTPTDGLTSFEQWDGSTWSAVDSSSYYLDGRLIWFNQPTTWNYSTSPTRYRATYNAGGEDAGGDEWAAEEDIKQAILLYVSSWYENRESEDADVTERAVNAILSASTRVVV